MQNFCSCHILLCWIFQVSIQLKIFSNNLIHSQLNGFCEITKQILIILLIIGKSGRVTYAVKKSQNKLKLFLQNCYYMHNKYIIEKSMYTKVKSLITHIQ